MNTEKELTGYPSVDKPWLKYYEGRKGKPVDVNKSIYRNFVDTASDNTDELAYIDYLTGDNKTYSDMLNEVDLFASALYAVGINHTSTVGLLTLNSCVDPIVWLAANKIGALTKFIDLDLNTSGLSESVSRVDILVIEDAFCELEPLINTHNIKTIIYGSNFNTSRENCIPYPDFLKQGDSINAVIDHNDSNKPSVIIYSSGSTGAAKPIVHSNKTIMYAIEKMMFSDFPINRENILVKSIPSHIGLGCITSMMTSILSGSTFINIKGLTYTVNALADMVISFLKGYPEWIKKYDKIAGKGILIFASPFFAKGILDNLNDIESLSMIKGMLYGGSKLDKDILETMNAAFAEKGYTLPICNGYGQNEMAGAVALNTVHYTKNGSAGYPTYNTQIKIVDRDTLEELPYNEVGLIIEKSDSMFLYYDGMPEKTLKSRIILNDGSEWFNSTDLGYIDQDGFVYITGRTTRTVIRNDYKVSLENIEDKLKSTDLVSDVAVIPTNNGKNLIAFICRKDKCGNNDVIIKQANLSELETITKVIILETIPYMNNGKIDYQALEKMANEL